MRADGPAVLTEVLALAPRAAPKLLEPGGADHVTETAAAPAPSAAVLTASGPTGSPSALVAPRVARSLQPSSCTY